MKKFDEIKSKNIDEFAEWLDEYGAFDGSPWIEYFNEKYCNKCDPEIVNLVSTDDEMEFSYCEIHNKCRFFPDIEGTPDGKQTVKLWLESEADT